MRVFVCPECGTTSNAMLHCRTPVGRTPYSIYEVLCGKLGRAPTSAELKADVKRIIREGAERAGK